VWSIAEALARCGAIHRWDCPEELPERPFDPLCPPRVLVIHRHRLAAGDADRLVRRRDRVGDRSTPGVMLCVSPYVRYDELERWSRLVDFVAWEATAAETLPRRVADLIAGPARERPGPEIKSAVVRIEVAAGDLELRQALVEACQAAGHRV